MESRLKWDENRIGLSLIFASISAVIYYHIIYPTTGDSNNLKKFILACFIFGLAFTVGVVCFRLVKNDISLVKWITIIVVAGICIWFILFYYNEIPIDDFWDPKKSPGALRQAVGGLVYIPTVLLIMVIISSFYRGMENIKSSKIIRGISTTVMAIYQAMLVYSPNDILDGWGYYSHQHAYTNSIIGVLFHTPYSELFKSDYGHYAIFYFIPVKIIHKIFGISLLQSVAVVTFLFCLIMFGFMYAIINKLVKSDYWYVLSLLVCANMSIVTTMYGNNYIAWPCRMLFMPIFLYIAYRYVNNDFNGKVINVLGDIVVILSLLWNFETGIILLILWFVTRTYYVLKVEEYKLSAVTVKILGLVILCIIELLSSFLVFNLYNIAMGGYWNSFNQFMYPLDVAMEGGLTWPLSWPGIFAPHVFLTIFYLCIIFYGISKLFLLRSITAREVFFFITALGGLGMMVYCVQRYTTQGFVMTHPLTCIILCPISESCLQRVCNTLDVLEQISLPSIKRIWESISIRLIITTSMLIVFSSTLLGSLVNIGDPIRNRVGTIWNYEAYSQFSHQVKSISSEGMLAIGKELPELFADQNRNARIYTIDWTNMPYPHNANILLYVIELIKNEDRIIAGTDAQSILGLSREWVRTDRVQYGRVVVDAMYHMSGDNIVLKYAENNNFSNREFIKLVFLNYNDILLTDESDEVFEQQEKLLANGWKDYIDNKRYQISKG